MSWKADMGKTVRYLPALSPMLSSYTTFLRNLIMLYYFATSLRCLATLMTCFPALSPYATFRHHPPTLPSYAISYARTTPCPVLSARMLLPGARRAALHALLQVLLAPVLAVAATTIGRCCDNDLPLLRKR
eukprot:1536246-Rhodomonas_salina.2